MTKNTQLTAAIVDAQAQVIISALNNGYLRVYTGPQPANASVAVSTQTLLAELRFASPASPAPNQGVISFSAMAPVNAANGGVAVWYRCMKSDGTTVVMDGNVGSISSDSNMNLNSTIIIGGALFTISSFTHTVDMAASGY